MRRARTAALPLCVVALAGCAGGLPTDRCAGADWQAVGLSDGASGFGPERLEQHRLSCGEVGVAPDAEAWEDGRQEGLRAYCRPEVAFRLGVQGRMIAAVCPAELQAELAAANETGWQEGWRLRELERWRWGWAGVGPYRGGFASPWIGYWP